MRKVPQFAQMVGRIGHGNEAPTRLQDARELCQPSLQIRYVVEHPRSDDRVELAVGESQLLDVADTRVNSLRLLDLDHALRLVDSDHLCAELVANPLCELSLPASDFEHFPRRYLRNGCEDEVARIDAFGIEVGRFARSKVVLALV